MSVFKILALNCIVLMQFQNDASGNNFDLLYIIITKTTPILKNLVYQKCLNFEI
ncbi:MAG: hypothetical protein V1646_04895 [bacterium]